MLLGWTSIEITTFPYIYIGRAEQGPHFLNKMASLPVVLSGPFWVCI